METHITFNEAFKYCITQPTYWIWLALAIFFGSLGISALRKTRIYWSLGHNFLLFVIIAIMTAAIFYRPIQVSANTTKEQAQKGVYIGY